MRRRHPLKSESEIRADVLRRITKRGKASLTETATVLGWSQPTVRGYVDRGQMQTIQYGKMRYVLLEELERWRRIR
jgi:predicted transcriptional regulator